MLFLVFVLRRRGGRVPQFPEGLDEQVAVPVVLKVEEDLPFLVLDDVGHDLEPFLVGRRQVLDLDFRLGGG